MNIKSILGFGLKVLALTILYMIIYALGAAVLGPVDVQQPAPEQAAASAMGLLLVSAVHTLVITLLILRSHWGGWRLMLAVGFAMYGVTTFMSQIETAYFGPAMGVPSEALPGLFLMGLPPAIIFVPLAVFILGRGRQPGERTRPEERLRMNPGEWAWKLAVISVAYLVLYFGFGYLVAWQNPNLVAYYGGGSNQEIFDLSRLIPLQALRAMLWVAFALPVIRMTRGRAWQVALVVALLYALPTSIPLVMPNPYMPDASVRMSHLVEGATSNFIFGLLVTKLLLWRPGHTRRDRLRRQEAA